jgi:diadenylate cyclase
MADDGRRPLRDLLAKVAPGSPLREGLERVLLARMGALVVLGDRPEVLGICTGGFHLDAELTPQRLSELAKMDGAIVLDANATRIAWANVHLVPDPDVPTSETGTRHRTAERVARSVGVPVVAVSQEMGTITIYRDELRHLLRPTESLIARATYLLGTLERFRQRFDEADASLTASEIGDVVTAGDVAYLLQRSEMVRRVGNEVENLLDELGEHGRLLRLQLEELSAGVAEEQRLVLADYLEDPGAMALAAAGAAAQGATVPATGVERALGRLGTLDTDELLGLERFVAALGGGRSPTLDTELEPRGTRLLRRLPELKPETISRLLEHFSGLHDILRATPGELASVTGLAEDQARLVKDGLAHLAESTILDRYQ